MHGQIVIGCNILQPLNRMTDSLKQKGQNICAHWPFHNWLTTRHEVTESFDVLVYEESIVGYEYLKSLQNLGLHVSNRLGSVQGKGQDPLVRTRFRPANISNLFYQGFGSTSISCGSGSRDFRIQGLILRVKKPKKVMFCTFVQTF